MTKLNEFQGVKGQVKQKRGCVGNDGAKSCKMCKVCSRNKEIIRHANVQIEK